MANTYESDSSEQPTDSVDSGVPEAREPEPQIHRIFRSCIRLDGSDIHLKAGASVRIRVRGELVASKGTITTELVERFIREITPSELWNHYLSNDTLDFTYQLPASDRFRLNVFRQQGVTSVAARRVMQVVPTFESLHLPPAIKDVALRRQGLVLVSGVTGSGKSTTIAAMIERILKTRACHVITIEDPIEFIFQDANGIVNQREVGHDISGFSEALIHLLREDPDVIMFSDMRDRESYDFALHACETGHLVLGSTHAFPTNAVFGHILDAYPPDYHQGILNKLSQHLEAVIGMRLVRTLQDDAGRVPAVEVMLKDPAISKLIEEGRSGEITEIISRNRSLGMQTFNQSLCELAQTETIERRTALTASPNPSELDMMLRGVTQQS
jgi:twitching motility protein PilT